MIIIIKYNKIIILHQEKLHIALILMMLYSIIIISIVSIIHSKSQMISLLSEIFKIIGIKQQVNSFKQKIKIIKRIDQQQQINFKLKMLKINDYSLFLNSNINKFINFF